MANNTEDVELSVEQVLDKHAKYYIRKTAEYMQSHGEPPEFVTGKNKQDLKSLAAINRIRLRDKLEAFDTAYDSHDYDQLRAYRAELQKELEEL